MIFSWSFSWRLPVIGLLAGVGMSTPSAGADGTTTTQTLLFIRHAEKPPEGLGQLACQGLNRALALPAVIRAKYKRLDAVFAPNPAQRKTDGKTSYDYVRPLATAEPTAIAFGLPVQADFGYTETGKLKAALLDPAYRDATILVAWEHHQLDDLVPDLINMLGGDPKIAPKKWPGKDFDSIWRVTIERTDTKATVSFAHEQEGLDGQPMTCPN